jgi:hypothetical protein
MVSPIGIQRGGWRKFLGGGGILWPEDVVCMCIAVTGVEMVVTLGCAGGLWINCGFQFAESLYFNILPYFHKKVYHFTLYLYTKYKNTL